MVNLTIFILRVFCHDKKNWKKLRPFYTFFFVLDTAEVSFFCTLLFGLLSEGANHIQDGSSFLNNLINLFPFRSGQWLGFS